MKETEAEKVRLCSGSFFFLPLINPLRVRSYGQLFEKASLRTTVLLLALCFLN